MRAPPRRLGMPSGLSHPGGFRTTLADERGAGKSLRMARSRPWARAQPTSREERCRWHSSRPTWRPRSAGRCRQLPVCPPELREWLGRSLQFGNQRSFAERLRELAQIHPLLGPEVFGDVPQFVRRVTDTRNYLTHWDETTKGKAARGMELWPLCEQLAVVLEACLLGEIGFSEDLIAESIRRASRHYSAIRLNPLLFPGTSGPASP